MTETKPLIERKANAAILALEIIDRWYPLWPEVVSPEVYGVVRAALDAIQAAESRE